MIKFKIRITSNFITKTKIFNGTNAQCYDTNNAQNTNINIYDMLVFYWMLFKHKINKYTE